MVVKTDQWFYRDLQSIFNNWNGNHLQWLHSFNVILKRSLKLVRIYARTTNTTNVDALPGVRLTPNTPIKTMPRLLESRRMKHQKPCRSGRRHLVPYELWVYSSSCPIWSIAWSNDGYVSVKFRYLLLSFRFGWYVDWVPVFQFNR